MDTQHCSRRQFLKWSTLSLLGLGFTSVYPTWREKPLAVGRVTTSLIYIYREPSLNGERVGKLFRDQLLNLLEEIQSPNGPRYNPRWYRIKEGYIHTAYIQRVDFRPPNEPLTTIPVRGVLGEVTVPFTRTFYQDPAAGWQPLYRLYYESLHWIKEVRQRADGSVWYQLSDPKNDSTYYVPATALRVLSEDEFSPIARDVPADQKRIQVSIEEQTVTAYEGEKVVMQVSISSGLHTKDPVEGEIGTDTPVGFFRITQKMPSRHMGNGHITNEVEAYELPGVPWTMAFHDTGAALHGSFWHDNFGHRMSHGCVNMHNAEALWLFRWTDPVYEPVTWYTNGLGTLVQVI